MFDSELDLANLKTVSSFDPGVGSTMAVGLPSKKLFTPASLLIESLIEQLCKLMDKDPRKQRQLYLSICSTLHKMNFIGRSYDMEEFQFMRSHYQKALYRLMCVTHQTSTNEFIPHPQAGLNYIPGLFELSRYVTEFRELAFIAKGGFGNVFKVQHKLDGGIYAVKKICLRYRSRGFLRNLNEVKLLAKLYHPNIVSYKAAWLENINRNQLSPPNVIACGTSPLSSSSSSPRKIENVSANSFEIYFQDSENRVNDDRQESYSKRTSLNGNFGVSCSLLNKSERNAIGFRKVTDCSSSSEISGTVENCKQMVIRKTRPDDSFSGTGESEWAMLYIQMQLCHATLRNWLDKRNQSDIAVDADVCLRIFKNITAGIEYIHSQDIVHHDIKPSNIFISEDLREVQVGDFGLACHFLSHSSPESVVEFLTHTSGRVGTELYAAPEQLKGVCNPKSDVFSLGIVLFELIHPFHTLMERSKLICQVKNGEIPSKTLSSYPHLTKTISKTVCFNYKERPSTTELLASLSFTEIEGMQMKIKEQEETISALRRESIEKDQLILFLQNQLKLFIAKENS